MRRVKLLSRNTKTMFGTMTNHGKTDDVQAIEHLRRPLPKRVERYLVRCFYVFSFILFTWLTLAYVILPMIWKHYEHAPAMENAPKTTLTAVGIPGDPLNVGFFGAEEDFVRSMLAAGWEPADPVTWRTSLGIASSVLLNRAYPEAPVSPLFVFGRKQDLAFEKAVGGNARHRNHARFWKSADLGRDGVPLWIGSATFDRSVGFSHRTGQITHHIAPDIDAERDALIDDLVKAGRIVELFEVTGVGATVAGHNGGGDWYYTDGEVSLGVLATEGKRGAKSGPEPLAVPTAVRLKDQFWDAVRPLLEQITSTSEKQGKAHE